MPKHKKKMRVDLPLLSMTLIKANVIGYALTLIFIIFASLLLTYTNLGPAFESWIVLIGAIASAALVGFDTAKMEGKHGYKWGLVGGLSYLVLFICLSIVLKGVTSIKMNTLITLTLATLISGAFAGMVSVARQK